MKKNFKKVFFSAALFTGILIAGACKNIGLGESVDTQPPEVAVSYPPVAATVRGELALYGTYKDDKSVAGVVLSVLDSDQNTIEEYKEVKAELLSADKTNGNWKCSIDTTKLTDGKYTFIVKVVDAEGNSTEDKSRTFSVDNTPPVFIISSPGIVKGETDDEGSEKKTSYGATFYLQGTIGEEHEISKATVSVYKKDGTFIKTFEKDNISTAGTASILFGNSAKGEDDDYYAIYNGSDESGDERNFYATVTLYDKAYEYNDPTGENGTELTGNQTSEVYIYDKVYDRFLSSADGGYGLTASDIMTILNGNSTLSNAEEIKNELLEKESEADAADGTETAPYKYKTDTSDSDKYLSFSLNPQASPKYVVNGSYELDLDSFEEDDIAQATNKADLTVSITASINNTGIRPYGYEKTLTTGEQKQMPSVKIWLHKFSGSSALSDKDSVLDMLTDLQAAVTKAEALVDFTDSSEYNAAFVQGKTKVTAENTDSTPSNEWTLIYDYRQQGKDSSSTVSETFSLKLPEEIDIESDAYYILGVTGSDMDGTVFEQKTTYIFKGTVTGIAPNLKIETPANNGTYTNSSGICFEGSAKLSAAESLFVEKLEASLSYSTADSGAKTYEESILVTKNEDGTFTARKITGKDDDGNYITQDLSGSDAFLYWPLTVYKTDEKGSATTEVEHEAGSFTFNTAKIASSLGIIEGLNKGELYTYSLTVTAQSSSKNSSSANRTVYVDTVAPVVDDEKSSVANVKTAAAVLEKWFGSESLSVYGVLTDSGSGVESVTYWLDKAVSEEESGSAVPAKNEDGTFKFNATISGFAEGSVHTLRYIATDKAGNKSAVKEYSIKTDLTVPSVTPKYYEFTGKEISGEITGSILTNKESDIVLYGLVCDVASGILSLEIPYATVTYTTAAVTQEAEDGTQNSIETDLAWFKAQTFEEYKTENATAISGWKAVIAKEKIEKGEIKYTAKDIAENSTSYRMFEFVVDTTLPQIEYKELNDADSDTAGTQVNGKIVLSGTASDNNSMDKITEIQYRIKDGEWTTIADGLDSKKTSAYSWSSVEIDTSAEPFAASKDGDLKVNFRAIALDKAGNYSDQNDEGLSLVINQNTDRPVIKISSLDKAQDIISLTVLRGTVSDDDGIKSFEYSFDDGEEWKTVEVSSGSWQIQDLTGGEYSLKFRITDTAGTVFTTGATDEGTFADYDRPFVMYAADTTKTDNTESIKFSVDLKAPSISSIKIASSESDTALTESSELWSEANLNFGKASKYMSIKIEATEDLRVNESAADDLTVKVGSAALAADGTTVKVTRSPEGSLNGDLVYIIGPVDILSVEGAEGTKTVSVNVKDASGRESDPATLNIYIDNGAPEVSVTSPNAASTEAVECKTNGIYTTDEAITGKYTIKGRISDTSGITKFSYLIPTNEQISSGVTKDTEGWLSMKTLSDVEFDKYTGSPLTSSNWKIEFTSSDFEENAEEHGSSLIYYATAKTDGNYTFAQTIDGSKNVYVPLYFYVEDATGNGEIVENRILVNADGGIPQVEITSHEDCAKAGTTVTLIGTASDDEELSSVKITKVEYATDTEISDATVWTQIEDLSGTGVVTKGSVDTSTAETKAQIIAEGTASWNARINAGNLNIPKKDTDGTDDEQKTVDIKALRFTVVSYDQNGTASSKNGTTCTRRIYVDSGNPELVKSETKIVGFDSIPESVDAEAVFEKEYSAGMYFAGDKAKYWYLKVCVSDDSSIVDIGFSSQTGSGYISAIADFVSSESAENVIKEGAGTAQYTALIPIATETEGKVYTTMTMNDGQHTDVTTSFTFNIDNTAPTLYGTDGNKLAENPDELRLMSSGEALGSTNVIENSDGSFTFGDELTEDGAGLAYVAVYFKKAANEMSSTKNRVYNPMFAKTDSIDNMTELADASEWTDGSVYINSENLPALCKTVTRDSSSTLTFEGLGSNYNINGTKWNEKVSSFGLVKIGGAYHKITAIDGDTATLDETVSLEFTQAEFIYAQLVDHEVTEGFDTSADTGVSNDDGDGFVEMVKRSGSTYKWSASVDSANISDGPAEIHIVAFDQAGNSNYGYVKTSIQNNRPRISRVMLATDLNGNGTFDYYNESSSILNDLSNDNTVASGTQFGEFVFYSTLRASDDSSSKAGVAQSKITLSGRTFKVKKDLLVLPEFVGGNGALYYGASFDNEKAVTQPVSGTNKLTSIVENLKLADKDGTAQKAASLIQNTGSAVNTNYGGAVITMDNTVEEFTKLDDGKVKYLAFTFWDSTQETTAGTDSLWAMINIPAIIDVVDDTAPSGTIKPFWWNSKEDSSFVYDDEENPLGHIDIDAGTTQTRPGVSGQVYINGTAYDETRIGEIHVVKPDTKSTDEKIIWYEDGSWKCAEGAEILSEEEPSQDGHTVEWRYRIDMTPYGVAEQKTVKTYVVDAQNNKMAAPATDDTAQTTATKQTALYKMDFVPYIKDIYTTSIGSSNRSRLGRYPVRAGEEMTIEGMNFAKDAAYTVNFYKTSTDGSIAESPVTGESVNGTITEDGKITVTAPEYSRWVEVVVGGVATKNNTNTNGGYNIESGYIANDSDNGLQTANAKGTDFWTDDRYISVWNTNTTFEGSINPTSGVVKKISDKNSGSATGSTTTGDAVGGGAFYNQAGTNSNLRISSNQHDRYFSAWSSNDLKIYGYLSTVGSKDNVISKNSEASFQAPGVDQMDYVIVNGMPYYVMQDNFVGGDSASVWGPGLFLSREGMNFDMSKFQKGNTIEESDTFAIIERQGSSGAAAKRNSSTGYDSVMYQFKNPRIAGTYVGTETMKYANASTEATGVDYIYVSYYDSYARCLKFAGFKVAHNIDKDNMTELYKWGNVAEYCGINPVVHSAPNNSNTYNSVSASNHMTDGKTVVAGFDTTVSNPTKFTEEAGEWNDIMVDSTDTNPIPVIIYYNRTNKCLEIARGKQSFPIHDGNVVTSTSEGKDNTEGTTGWTKSTIKPSGAGDFGRYVSAAMDEAGNIHASAVDATKNKVYYLYITKSGESYSIASSAVIGTTSGCWTDIELTNGGITTGKKTTTDAKTEPKDVQPVISWMDKGSLNSTEAVRISYLADNDTDGTAWETMTDPAVYAANDQRTSVMADVYEGKDPSDEEKSTKAKIAVSFNSDMLALDFLRGEE